LSLNAPENVISQNLTKLKYDVEQVFEKQMLACLVEFKELTLEVNSSDLLTVCRQLCYLEFFEFDTLIDLCGIDYLTYSVPNEKSRFAVVIHLLSTSKNHRLRLKVFCSDENLPEVPSLTKIWPAAEWYEREAFDLFGIVFDGNEDLRRILTDYGFVGHPFRKDFPVSGYVEMRYDPNEKRVIYQPVTIEKRENVPRIVREEDYGKTFDHG
jgi:NADH-quinone oxidoreductase subunit C